MTNSPTTTIFALILTLLCFFAAATGVTIFYFKKDSRRLSRSELLQQATEGDETISPKAHFRTPEIWEVWADKYPKPTSKWEDLLVSLCFANFLPFFIRLTFATASHSVVRSRSTVHPPTAAPPEPGIATPTENGRGVEVRRQPGCRHPVETEEI